MSDSALRMSPLEIGNAHRPSSPPVNLEELAQALGLLIIRRVDLSHQIAAMIIRDRRHHSSSGYAIHGKANDNHRRQRFTIAHETAHYVLHRDLIGDGVTDDALYRSSLGDWYERQANKMAADILMPPQLVISLFKGGMRSLASLAKAFDVSIDAMRIRLEELGLA